MAIIAIIPIVVLLYGVGVACLLWLRRGRNVEGLEPRCAACGYIVHGLPAPKCPECGADLAKPRAVVTTGRRRPGRVARSISWSIFCVLVILIPVAFVWEHLVMPTMPRVKDENEQVLLSSPASKGYRSIGVIAHTHGLAYPKGPDALVAWLRRAAVQGETGDLRREMTHAMTQVQQAVSRSQLHSVSSGPDFSGVSDSSGASINPVPWLEAVPLFPGGIVWCVGMVWIMLKPSKARGDSHMIN